MHRLGLNLTRQISRAMKSNKSCVEIVFMSSFGDLRCEMAFSKFKLKTFHSLHMQNDRESDCEPSESQKASVKVHLAFKLFRNLNFVQVFVFGENSFLNG